MNTRTLTREVVSFVLSKVGYPYSQPLRKSGKAFDCSSLAYYAWKSAGVDILFGGGTTAAAEAEGLKYKTVKEENLQPGDLIFFTGTYDAGEPVTHIGIYVGNGQMIHCGHPVQYTSINSPYWQSHFYGFGRW